MVSKTTSSFYSRRKFYWCTLKCEKIMLQLSCSFFQYCYHNIEFFSNATRRVIALNLLCFTFGMDFLFLFLISLYLSLTKGIAKCFSIIFAIDFNSKKSVNCCYYNSWKRDNYIGSNTEKKP